MNGDLMGALAWLQSTDGRLSVKLGIALFGAVLCAIGWWRARSGARAPWAAALLTLTTLVSVAGYFEFGALRYERYLNPHDVFHYYLGAKYSQEHRYLDLYRASLVADVELNAARGKGPAFREDAIRDLRTHQHEKARDVVQEDDEIRGAFGAERWSTFVQDVRFFQDAVSPYDPGKWTDMLRDKGYNATPVWNAVARAIAWRAPTTSAEWMAALPMLDLALLLGTFALVLRAFGWRTAALTLLYYGVSYTMAYPHIKGGFLRLDWLCCVVAAGALLRLGRPALAGGALAYATLARVFPALFALGPVVLLGENLIRRWAARRWGQEPPALRADLLVFLVSLGASALALVGLSILADGGVDLWRIFLSKIEMHNQDMSSNRVGFKYLYYGIATGFQFDRSGMFRDGELLFSGLSVLSLLPSLWVMRRRPAWEALFLGIVPIYFLTAPTFYYFVMLVAPFLFFAARLEQGWRAVGAASLFLVSALAYGLDFDWPHGYPLFCAISAGFFIVCALLWVSAGRSMGKDELEGVPAIPRAFRAWEAGLMVVLLGLVGALMLSAPRRELLPPITVSEPVAPGPGEATLAFVGDVMFSRNVERDVRASGRKWDALFDEARAALSEVDIAVANLETPVSSRGSVIEKRYTFRSPPDALPALARSGIDVVSLANNHTLDYGPDALADTESLVAAAGLRVGGVAKVGEPQIPLILEVRGLKIGMLFYCDPRPTYSCAKEYETYDRRPVEATDEAIERDLAALRPQVDVLAVVIHWGVEYRAEPTKQTRELGRRLVNLGADIVAGSHPHVQHPIERYKDGLILYSLGNFVFDQQSRPPTRVSRIVRVVVGEDRIGAVQILPMVIVRELWTPRPLTPGFVDLALDRESLRTWTEAPEVAR